MNGEVVVAAAACSRKKSQRLLAAGTVVDVEREISGTFGESLILFHFFRD